MIYRNLSVWVWIMVLTGCASTSPLLPPTADKIKSVVDASISTPKKPLKKKGNLVDKLRQREDAFKDDPAWAPIPPEAPFEAYTTSTGSLFRDDLAQDLYDGRKPRAIGDIVTVLLEEKTKAQKTATSDLNKSTNLSMAPIKLGGQSMTLKGFDLSYDMANDNQFAGSRSADQSNSIQGSISVEVVNVLANGNLVIRGEKWLQLNTGEEFIRVSGHIRPDDISEDNTIVSRRLSNTRIQYSGTGSRQDTQSPSWLAQFFNLTL